ncbi:choloylglycine hydrolase family protein [Thalassotalea sp. PS06]|uniref:choloylglycine hydrolase family protein n=1 Tax=Thalassotalea sp. PS06 TaxID=2594005 RepID=UPI001C8F59AE|nr:choloylglycine hydrolase family protein [Thalassotalea sp. PS06]
MKRSMTIIVTFFSTLSLIFTPITQACTGITLHSEDGAAIPGRTMEFSFDIQSQISIIPAGTEIETLITEKKYKGFKYKSKYGFVGLNGMKEPVIVDGLNEKGLYFGAHYFTGQAKFSKLTDENASSAINSAELGSWLLANFATVKEVKKVIPKTTVVESYIEAIKGNVPVHYRLIDASGESIVIEYTEDGLSLYDNDINAFTNSPRYSWHMTNLVNYLGLTPVNRPAKEINGKLFAPFGEGTGLVGMPGDYSGPSRFVRAAVFANTAIPSKTAEDGVFHAFHILNAFDIPKGAIRSEEGEEVAMDYTIWTSVADTKNLIYYIKTYDSQRLEKIDLAEALQNISKVTNLPLDSKYQVIDRTPK